jgi:hypothetical protein
MSDTVDISYATIPVLIDYMISVYKKGIAKDTSAFARHSKLCNSSDYRWAPGIICGPRDHCNVPCSSPISSQGLLSWFLGDQKLTGGDYIGIGPRDENLAPGISVSTGCATSIPMTSFAIISSLACVLVPSIRA